MSEPNMFSKHDMYTQIELLKKEVQDMKGIYQRLDTAIVRSVMCLILSIVC